MTYDPHWTPASLMVVVGGATHMLLFSCSWETAVLFGMTTVLVFSMDMFLMTAALFGMTTVLVFRLDVFLMRAAEPGFPHIW